MSQESFHQSGNQELFSVRSQLQKRLMEKVGVNDKNFAETWRAPHYAEDYDLAFKIFLSHHPDVTHEFETDQEKVVGDLQFELDRVHARREQIAEELMREYGGGFGAQTKDRRDEWERKYGDLYNHAFLELIEENTNDVMLADSKIERVKEIMQRIERERSFPPEKAAA